MESVQKYKIRVGKYSLQRVSPAQLKMIHSLICDFFSKEDEIPAAGITGYSHNQSQNQILITKDACFDSLSREFETEYCIRVGEDTLTNISDSELINLYFTLQSFLIHSEKLPVESQKEDLSQSVKDGQGLNIDITTETINDYLIHPLEDFPYISKRVWVTDKNNPPESEYGLSVDNGAIENMSRKQLSALQEKIGNLLNKLQTESKK